MDHNLATHNRQGGWRLMRNALETVSGIQAYIL